jgi:DNA-binding IclR family transcriptional regulator
MENTVETVNKALDILEIFLHKDGELSLAELSAYSRFNKATVYRLVSTLSRRGYIRHREKNGKYSLGLKSLDFTYAIRKNFSFIELAYLYLSRLCKTTNISTYVAVLDEESALVIEEIAVIETMRLNSPIGKRLPLYATATGRVLLSSMPLKARQDYYNRNAFQPYTHKTITDPVQLEKELEIIRREGVAFGEEDYKPGLTAVAAPIRNGRQETVAAAGVVGTNPQAAIHGWDKIAFNLKSCTAEISQVLGRIS